MTWVVRGEFRKLWVGQLVSASGSAITMVALPLVAVLTLRASAMEMGLLAALTVLPHLVFGLPAGVWVDRWSLRRVLVVTDVGRAVLLGSIPLAAAAGALAAVRGGGADRCADVVVRDGVDDVGAGAGSA
jgi:MFS family permease